MNVNPNLEHDLHTADWLVDKVKNNTYYAQNLYAALCNNEFVRNEVWPILKGEVWSCSWRYAGRIVSELRGQGDYLDWYCSGHQNYTGDLTVMDEGVVTDEIRNDLFKLGWIIVNELE